MAFILKSAKLIPGLVGFTRQRGLIGRRKHVVFLQGSSTSRLNVFLVRNTASVAAKVVENNSSDFEKSLFQLGKDIETRNVSEEDIREVFEGIKQKGEITYSQMILLLTSCTETAFLCSSSERILLAEEIWKTAKDFGTKFHISYYNALLNVFVENNHKFSPEEFLNILNKDGIEPNEVTYRKLLRAYCQQGNIEGANSILDKMKELRSTLNEDDFNSLILGHCEAGDLEKAVDIINVMEEKEMGPSDKSYLYLLCGYAKYGKFEELNKLLDDLPNKGIDVKDSLLLEVIYALAVNGHNELKDIDMILSRLKKDTNYSKLSNRVIQRLLHKRLDSVALRVFEKVEAEGRQIEHILPHSRFILLHFLRYRDFDETFDMCCDMTRKGWCRGGEGYILRYAFLKKDERFCLQLLQTMAARKMEIRVHYFWPVIIKASKKGNSELIDVLRSMPTGLLQESFLTVSRIICENYKFGEDWRLDFETLNNCGCKISVLARCFASRALKEKRYDEAEEIVASHRVYNSVSLLNLMVHILKTEPDAEKHFVNILYCLAHDDFLNQKRTKRRSGIGDDSDENSSAYELNEFVFCLRHLPDKQLLRILQGMLEKKMRITSKAASIISSNFKNQEISEVVTKLASPELRFQLDEDLLEKKYIFEVRGKSEITEERRKELPQVKQPFSSFEEMLVFLDQCEGMKHLDVVAVLEQSTQSLKGLPVPPEVTGNYFGHVCKFITRGRTDFAETVFDFGMQIGILSERHMINYVRKLFHSRKSSKAVNKYCAYVERKLRAPCSMEFLKLAVAGKDDKAIKKLVSVLCDLMPGHVLLMRLALVLANHKEFKKAQKILDDNGLKLTESEFYRDCSVNYSRYFKANTLENYLKFVRNMENFDRVPLYKLLIKKYAETEDVENAKKLWLEIEEDDISDYEFLEQMRDFVSTPTLESLKKLSGNFTKMKRFFISPE